VTPALLQDMVKIIAQETSPEKIILFGSYAKEVASPESDIDFMVIESGPFSKDWSRGKEIARIRQALWDFLIPIDILVFTKDEVEKWKDATNHIIAHSLREGKVLYDRL